MATSIRPFAKPAAPGSVLGDHPLSKTIEILEMEYSRERRPELVLDIIAAIRSRYDFVDPLSTKPSQDIGR
jgi:hypothetical protein